MTKNTDEKKQKTGRDPLDRYYTPHALARGCLRWLALTAERGGMGRPQAVAEPCAGAGAFGWAAREVWGSAVALEGCDIDRDASPGFRCVTAPAAEWTPRGVNPWILTNPHYADVYTTIRVMRDMQERAQAPVLGLLLRATTLERVMASDDVPHQIAITGQRPRWEGPGGAALRSGDTCGSVFCVWYRAWGVTLAGAPSLIVGLPQWRAVGRTGGGA
jgi:hypothetical protein